MSFSINLYSSVADTKEVDKTSKITEIGNAITLAPTKEVDIMAPVFEIDYNSSYLNCNYIYCATFGRYYYVNDMDIQVGKKIIFKCIVDPLMSFKTNLANCNGTIIRSESVGGPTYIPDSKLPVDPNRKEIKLLHSKKFKQAPTEFKYYFVSLKASPVIFNFENNK